MGFRQVLAGRAFAFDQVGHGVQPEAIDPYLQPELHDIPHLLPNGRIVVVQIGLMAEEAMPVIGFGNRVPRPVGHFGIQKNDSGAAVAIVCVAPHIPVAERVIRRTCATPETTDADRRCDSGPAR